MIFGVPRESGRHEHRVGLTPYAVSILTHEGHTVYVERDAGRESHFADADYTAAGGSIVHNPEEVYGRADTVCRVGPLAARDVTLLQPGATVCGFLHLAVKNREYFENLAACELTMIGYEILERKASRPILASLSEIAGQVAVHTAAKLLEYEQGGRGVVLGTCPGIPPATVVMIGAGHVGRSAARQAAMSGAHVIVLDQDVGALHRLLESCRPFPVVTLAASDRNIGRATRIADVVIAAVNSDGGRVPCLVSEEMVQRMKDGSVLLDLSIDDGGCVETSRPTTPDAPTFQLHGVIHYCVPNMTASVPRTASRAIALSAATTLSTLGREGVDAAIAAYPGLRRGLYTHRGRLVHRGVAEALDLPVHDDADLNRP